LLSSIVSRRGARRQYGRGGILNLDEENQWGVREIGYLAAK